LFRDDLAILVDGGGQLFIRACFNLPTLGDLYRIATYKALLDRRRRKESEVFELRLMDPGLVCWCIVRRTRRYLLRPPAETGGETKRESFPKATVGAWNFI
jgi:hypothetical protein